MLADHTRSNIDEKAVHCLLVGSALASHVLSLVVRRQASVGGERLSLQSIGAGSITELSVGDGATRARGVQSGLSRSVITSRSHAVIGREPRVHRARATLSTRVGVIENPAKEKLL